MRFQRKTGGWRGENLGMTLGTIPHPPASGILLRHGASQLLNKAFGSHVVDSHLFLPSPNRPPQFRTEDSTEDVGSGASLGGNGPGSPPPGPCFGDSDWFSDEPAGAKRARVGTTIRGTGFPTGPGPESFPGDRGGLILLRPEKAEENKRKRKQPRQRDPDGAQWAGDGRDAKEEESRQLREQLRVLQEQLKQLQERFFPIPSPQATEKDRDPVKVRPGNHQPRRVRLPGGNQSHGLPWTGPSEPEKPQVSEEEGQFRDHRFLPPEGRSFSETLKKELTGAVSRAVDSALGKLSGRPSRFPRWGGGFWNSEQGSRSASWAAAGPCGCHPELADRSGSQVQTGAWSLGPHQPCRGLEPPLGVPGPRQDGPSARTSPRRGDHVFCRPLGSGQNSHRHLGPPQISSSPDGPSPGSPDRPWGAGPPPSSAGGRRQHPASFAPTRMGRLPPVKVEFGVADPTPFSSVHDGLTPGHLKKAKLMFFFTRYPNSNILKTYFPDVQFNRCITSQLIKWFSNFREFYYIQMEKFARQAVLEGVTNAKTLIVPRDSEIFRSLNTHYNKGNDFEVPDRFLEIAGLTLQEFFEAVAAGRDSDPSWKKPIYKVISKLDSDIPEAFKSSTCFQSQN
ncbi:prospero homeobox protein 2 [Tachyglossus aculeatus]|uniref:prospero homeobox protein 2 n=1 Tax=Tachyglossus aculeatus TaxID=9261 RepID=UPI0018F3A2B3|nr:prospero homeobox protein 2 [Tachyglossus aculeatus]